MKSLFLYPLTLDIFIIFHIFIILNLVAYFERTNTKRNIQLGR